MTFCTRDENARHSMGPNRGWLGATSGTAVPYLLHESRWIPRPEKSENVFTTFLGGRNFGEMPFRRSSFRIVARCRRCPDGHRLYACSVACVMRSLSIAVPTATWTRRCPWQRHGLICPLRCAHARLRDQSRAGTVVPTSCPWLWHCGVQRGCVPR